MMNRQFKTRELCTDVLISLRKIIQAIDLHSRKLSREYGLTGPQLVILQEISKHDQISVTELGKLISLSQGTVTDILLRLERKGLITKKRSPCDKRRVDIQLTEKSRDFVAKAPPPLQETFLDQFSRLEEWEQLMILSSLNRLVDMMSAKKIEAPALLAAGPLNELSETGDDSPGCM